MRRRQAQPPRANSNQLQAKFARSWSYVPCLACDSLERSSKSSCLICRRSRAGLLGRLIVSVHALRRRHCFELCEGEADAVGRTATREERVWARAGLLVLRIGNNLLALDESFLQRGD